MGLDDWSVPEIAAACMLPAAQVWPYIQTLKDANRIHKTERGRYRTSMARVASDRP